MTCEQFQEIIGEYVDGTLTPAVRAQCAEHVMSCPACRQLLGDVQATMAACRQAAIVEPPGDLVSRILRATPAGPMMSCAVFDELILDYFEGYISASDYHIFEDHFQACPRCQRLLTSIRLARQLCHEARAVPAPDDLQRRIMRATVGIDRVPIHRKWRAIARRWWGETRAKLARIIGLVLAPEGMTAVILSLATVGFLLVEVSDDMTLSGVYRQARIKAERVFAHARSGSLEGRRIASRWHRVTSQLSGVLRFGADLFVETTDRVGYPTSGAPRERGEKKKEPLAQSPGAPLGTRHGGPAIGRDPR
ncbi:MAG: hypothetical protein D6723_08555 [Acidobacteria bacterium]|nr:MAG: hypothetical protein D6723_08555 [Acidobacteriota bacterium]